MIQYLRSEEQDVLSVDLESSLSSLHEGLVQWCPKLLPVYRKLVNDVHIERTSLLQERSSLLGKLCGRETLGMREEERERHKREKSSKQDYQNSINNNNNSSNDNNNNNKIQQQQQQQHSPTYSLNIPKMMTMMSKGSEKRSERGSDSIPMFNPQHTPPFITSSTSPFTATSTPSTDRGNGSGSGSGGGNSYQRQHLKTSEHERERRGERGGGGGGGGRRGDFSVMSSHSHPHAVGGFGLSFVSTN